MAAAANTSRRLVREFAAVAHQRELSSALREIRADFDRWEQGEIDAFELNARIHQYHDGVSRDLWKKYAARDLDSAVAVAIVAGVLRKEELPPTLLEHLAIAIRFYERDATL